MAANAAASRCSEVLRLRPGVYRAVDRDGREYLLHSSASQPLGRLTELQRDTLRRLADSDCSDESLRGVAELEQLLEQLRSGGWLHITVVCGDQPGYTIEPFRRPTGPPRDGGSSVEAGLVLSRFAVIRRSGNDLLIESPRSWCAIRIHDADLMTTVAEFIGTPATSAPGPLAERLKADLAWATMVVESPGDEDSAFELRQWSPHELWFHQRSRGDGVPDRGFGRTRWADGLFEPVPGRRPSLGEPIIDLPRPDLDAIRERDATLTGVLEDRRSMRRHDDQRPITVAQIGEFLYRAAGLRYSLVRDGVEHTMGPNPSGGALDPLEFYLAVRLAEGIEPGLYRYDRFEHRLEHICGRTRAVRRMIDAAQSATGGSRESPTTYPPQLVVVLAARFGRVGWSYETLTYSLILKQVGVAYQTMYCVATAMGLAPCALGASDPVAFADATGLEPLREGIVGEFILGSRPALPLDVADQQVAM